MSKIKIYLVVSFWFSVANVFMAFAMTGVSLFSATAVLMAATFLLFILMLLVPSKPDISNGDGVENEPMTLPAGAQIRGGACMSELICGGSRYVPQQKRYGQYGLD